MPKEDQLKPLWRVGDAWVIETSTKPVQLRSARSGVQPIVSQWKFTVAAREKVGEHECYRVEITVEPDPKNQPVTTLWVDAKAMALRQMQTQLPNGGRFTTVTESYQFGRGQPAPVAGPLTALPVDLPMFVGGRAGEQTFSYESVSGPAAVRRDPADVGFAVDIKQTMTPVKYEAVRSLVPPDFSRDVEAKPLVEVKLQTAERSIRQIWQAGQPWPVFTQNRTTTARLVKVVPSAPK